MKLLNPTQERGHVGLGRNDIMRVIYTILACVLFAADVRGEKILNTHISMYELKNADIPFKSGKPTVY